MASTWVFDEAVDKISRAYEDLGHELGWRFLASPARTLSEDTKMLFSGINPGGSRYEPPLASVEGGNAYRVERWGKDGGLSSIQVQVRLLYGAISDRLGNESAADLMDGTLAANFCPFRSPSWDALPKRPQSVAFSRGLWGTSSVTSRRLSSSA